MFPPSGEVLKCHVNLMNLTHGQKWSPSLVRDQRPFQAPGRGQGRDHLQAQPMEKQKNGIELLKKVEMSQIKLRNMRSQLI